MKVQGTAVERENGVTHQQASLRNTYSHRRFPYCSSYLRFPTKTSISTSTKKTTHESQCPEHPNQSLKVGQAIHQRDNGWRPNARRIHGPPSLPSPPRRSSDLRCSERLRHVLELGRGQCVWGAWWRTKEALWHGGEYHSWEQSQCADGWMDGWMDVWARFSGRSSMLKGDGGLSQIIPQSFGVWGSEW